MSAALMSVLRWLGVALYYVGLARVVMYLNRARPKVLLYHAVEPAPSDFTRDLATSVTPQAFDRHLAFLERHYRVITLQQLTAGEVPDRSILITFDDGYRSVYEHALPLLASRGMPATMYLVTNVIGNEALIWVNEMNWLLRNGPPHARRALCGAVGLSERATIAQLLERLRTCYTASRTAALLDALRAAAGVEGRAFAQRARLYLDWEEIERMREQRFSFGSHTVTHPSLPRLSDAEQTRELLGARDALAPRLGTVDSLAYPFGDHSAATRRLAVEAGYLSLMEVGGVNDPLDLHRVGRVPVTAPSTAGFFADLEVVTPLKAAIARWLGKRSRE